MIENINQHEHGDGLVISEHIILKGTRTENCEKLVLNLFWQHLNMKLSED